MLNKKSEANLETAKLCLLKKQEDFYSVGVSRAYYAIFQATKCLLVNNCFDYNEFLLNNSIEKKERPYSHGSIRMALNDYLRDNGYKSRDDLTFFDEMRITFQKLYTWRRTGDYEEDVIDEKSLKEAIKRAETFINKLEKYS